MCDRLAVVDVDGTLTRSDVRGYVETVYLGVYDYIHTGVVEFLNNMVWRMNYCFTYLLSMCQFRLQLDLY